MRLLSGSRVIRIVLILTVLIVVADFESRPSKAVDWYFVTVRIAGLYPNVGTRVYASGHLMGTIYGEGVLTFNTTWGPIISVDACTPDGYPYYGLPYYSYPGASWHPYGLNGVAFICRGNSQTVSANTTIPTPLTFRYDPMFFLYVKSDRGNPEGTGWYPAGTLARIAVTTPIEETGSIRYRFDKWTGGYLRDSTTNPVTSVLMDSPKIVEAVWITQYRLAVNSPYGQVSGGGWYDKDQTATFSVTSPAESGEGIRQVFNSWTGDYSGSSLTGTVAMNGPKTVTATWKTQYFLTIDPKGGQVDRATQWLDSGTSVSVTATSPCNPVERKSRMIFLGWHGSTTSTLNTVTLMMDSPKTLVATWKMQYYLIVETKRGAATGEGWYDTDSVAEFSVPVEVPMEPPLGLLGGRYLFGGWSGDSKSASPRATILMDGPHIVAANWNSDYATTYFIIIMVMAGLCAVVLLAKRKMFRAFRERRNNPRSRRQKLL